MADSYNEELIWRIWLTLAFGVSNPVINYLLEKYKSAYAAHDVVFEREDPELVKIISARYDNIRKCSVSDCEKIVSDCEKNDIGITLSTDENYPRRLLKTDNPPAVLYYKGDISGINMQAAIAMVGTRHPSDYSRKAASAFAKDLAKCGFAIVSGFAVGIDIASHLAAVSAGGVTYAVLGSGIDYNYPKENFPYRQDIWEHGAFISEYPPSFRPGFATFPPRNRIIAGLSVGAAVIEAGEKSGSLITANHCNQQEKPLFVLPPPDIFDVRYGGNVTLIRDGAIPIMSARDVLYELYPENRELLNDKAEDMLTSVDFINTRVYKRTGMGPGRRRLAKDNTEPLPPLPGTFGHKETKKKASAAKKKASGKQTSPKPDLRPQKLPEPAVSEKSAPDLSALGETERLIVRIIINFGRPAIADEIAAEADMDISELLSVLTDMEMDGIISCGIGGGYVFKG